MLPTAASVRSHHLQALAAGGSVPPVALAEQHLLTQSCAGRWIGRAVGARRRSPAAVPRRRSPAVTLGCRAGREDLAVCQLFDLIQQPSRCGTRKGRRLQGRCNPPGQENALLIPASSFPPLQTLEGGGGERGGPVV